MKKILPALLCLVSITVVSAQMKTGSPDFHLKGIISKTSPASKIYLLYQNEGRRIMDSSAIVNSRFEFKGTATDPLFATLVLDHDGKGIQTLMRQFVDECDVLGFYLHEGTINLKGRDSISEALFIKSGINKDYMRLRTLENIQAANLLIKLSARMQRDKDTASAKRYVAYYDSVKLARQPILKRFAIENPASYIALVALKEYAGAFPNTDEIDPIFNNLSAAVKNSKAGKEFEMLLKSASTLAIGKPAPAFNQPDTSGKLVSLSDFKGSYVLLDFWASWCGPCRSDNPKWVKVYEMLKGKNFTILGVSLDGHDTRNGWLKAIKSDSLTWPQVSDLKHWDNAVAKQYGINAIPQNVLVDPDGRIAARNIAPDMLQELIKKQVK